MTLSLFSGHYKSNSLSYDYNSRIYFQNRNPDTMRAKSIFTTRLQLGERKRNTSTRKNYDDARKIR